jgi:hypothetical protein
MCPSEVHPLDDLFRADYLAWEYDFLATSTARDTDYISVDFLVDVV